MNLVLDDVLDAKINQVTGCWRSTREHWTRANRRRNSKRKRWLDKVKEEKSFKKKSEESEYDALDKWSNEINRTRDILFANLC